MKMIRSHPIITRRGIGGERSAGRAGKPLGIIHHFGSQRIEELRNSYRRATGYWRMDTTLVRSPRIVIEGVYCLRYRKVLLKEESP